MNGVMNDIWPHLLTALIAVFGTYFGAVHKLKVDIEVLKKTSDNLRSDINKIEDDMRKEIVVIQKRLDSHSKKNDEIINLINDLKVEMVKQLGTVATAMGKISSDVENINRVFTINDTGIKFKKGE